MSGLLGGLLLAAGCLLALPEVFTVVPDQRLFLLGLVLAVAGGALLAERGHGRDHGHR